MPHWCTSEMFLHPSGTKFIMNTIGLKFLTNEAKKLTKWAVCMSKKAFKTCLRVQYNAAVLPIYFVYGGVKYVYQSYTSSNEQEPSLEPNNDVIIGAMKKLRNSVVSGINGISSRRDTETVPIPINGSVNEDGEDDDLYHELHDISGFPLEDESCAMNPRIKYLGVNEFSGSDLMWDVPIIEAKARCFSKCIKEGNGRKLEAAKKALEDHPIQSAMPKTRQEYNQMLNNAKNWSENFTLSVAESNDTAQYRNLSNGEESIETTSDVLETNPSIIQVESSTDNASSLSQGRPTDCVCNSVLTRRMFRCREIIRINRTLRKIQTTCACMLEGLSTLNKNLDKVTSMKEKLVGLEFQVDESKRLLQEVETDRFIMNTKLLTLEKLINEEEQYLHDSGYFESGNNPGISSVQ